MSIIMATGTYAPPHVVGQKETAQFAKEQFGVAFRDIDRLLSVFDNGLIEKRHFSAPLEWFRKPHTFKEKNDKYIECAVEYSIKAIERCIGNYRLKDKNFHLSDIDAIFFVSSTGVSTPSIDARIMNKMPFSRTTKRIPLWGLGCAGGAAGLSRAHEYCMAFPEEKVLLVSLELCSLTFQHEDFSKSNLIGTSLFSDGAACVLVAGEKASVQHDDTGPLLHINASQSSTLEHSEDVMGWEVMNEGLYVVFSKDIPTLVKDWLPEQVYSFFAEQSITVADIKQYIAHPGGKKVLQAYRDALDIEWKQLDLPLAVLKNYGNMSSVTILFVLEEAMKNRMEIGDKALGAALGPGFSSELVLMEWR
ncbi:type III polyketide synthase [Bacillus marinisedimentorum]|uniref:type III polyketide synthase n=1 Tax=Bacillus marinisedimentorum TaxID=1821260 RepID=UPI0007E242D0|nr:3-oxoacyl-[acyl-carrier-protein] synthase III C-terminal domain-containing protein [Bacillus marinisedimentorum]